MCATTRITRASSKRQKTASDDSEGAEVRELDDGRGAEGSSNAPSSSCSWPTSDPCPQTKKFPSNTLFSGLDDMIWAAMAHLDPEKYFNTDDKNPKKQIAIREALKLIGMDWVGISSASCRPKYGAKFDEAKKIYDPKKGGNGWRPPKHPLPELTRVNVSDVEWSSSQCADTGEIIVDGQHYTNNEVGDLQFPVIKNGCADNECIFPDAVSSRINSAIQQTGMVIIRGAVDVTTIETLKSGVGNNGHPDASKVEEAPNSRAKRLIYSFGDGVEGEEVFTRNNGKPNKVFSSYYADLEQSTFLNRLQDIIVHSLNPTASSFIEDLNKRRKSKKGTGKIRIISTTSDLRKCIVLKYSKGGENWAHQDGNSDGYFPCQALLILSDSDEYDGGEFYVVKHSPNDGVIVDDGGSSTAAGVSFVRTCCPKLNAGDLVIFQADSAGGYFHGMKMVTRGERVAVGLLQQKPID